MQDISVKFIARAFTYIAIFGNALTYLSGNALSLTTLILAIINSINFRCLFVNKAIQMTTVYHKKISNLYDTRSITLKRVTSGGAHLCGLTPGQHSSEETSQRWRTVGDTVTDFGNSNEIMTSRADLKVKL